MANYIDGFVLPVPRDRVKEYKRVAEAVAEIYKEHGAIDYLEFVEKQSGLPVYLVSVGPDREETIVLRDAFSG